MRSARFSEMLISPYVKERLAAARFTMRRRYRLRQSASSGRQRRAGDRSDGNRKTLAFLIR